MEEKKSSSFTLKIVVFISIAAFIAVMIYSELDRRGIRDAQKEYQSTLSMIKQMVDAKNCADAAEQYIQAKEQRDKIAQSGLYYSLESHAKQAHAIEIAECFANQDQFDEAIDIIEMEEVHDPDYLFRAASIYERSGDVEKAEAAKIMAEKFEL